ncbi:hypothetical protein ACT7C1_16105 [Bacillus paranthracis]
MDQRNLLGQGRWLKKDEITFSSATIRNEMADLEELGFIEKTHSSSGRVPSEKRIPILCRPSFSAAKFTER